MFLINATIRSIQIIPNFFYISFILRIAVDFNHPRHPPSLLRDDHLRRVLVELDPHVSVTQEHARPASSHGPLAGPATVKRGPAVSCRRTIVRPDD